MTKYNTHFIIKKNYKTTCVKCIKTVYYGLTKDKLNNETKQNSETDPQINGQLIYYKSTNTIPWEQKTLLKTGTRTTGRPYRERNAFQL